MVYVMGFTCDNENKSLTLKGICNLLDLYHNTIEVTFCWTKTTLWTLGTSKLKLDGFNNTYILVVIVKN